MKRVEFKMKLKEGYAEEYKKRHDEIWPELKQVLSNCGIQDYSIFLDADTNTLFAVHKIIDGKESDSNDGSVSVSVFSSSAQDLGSNPIVQKWWVYMADIMETNADNSPVTVSLKEVFHLI